MDGVLTDSEPLINAAAIAMFKELGLTAAHELLVRWICGNCGGDVLVLRRLSECWRDCPAPESGSSREAVFLSEDMRFLKSLGVRVSTDAG